MATAGPIVADLRAESDELDALVAELPAARWAEPTPAPGWTIAHQIAHLLWTDRVALLSVNDEAGFTEVLGAAAADPSGFVDRGAEDIAAAAPAELLADWRRTRGQLHDALLTVPEGSQAAMVRPADECGVNGHRPHHGDLGARPRRGRCPWRETARDRAVAGRRPHRCPDPRLRLRDQRPCRTCRSVPGRADGPRRLRLDVGARGCGPTRDGFGGGLLHAGHAAPAALPLWTSRPTATTHDAG